MDWLIFFMVGAVIGFLVAFYLLARKLDKELVKVSKGEKL